MTISLDKVPRQPNGTWAREADDLVAVLEVNPILGLEKAVEWFPNIPVAVLKQIFEERKRRKKSD